MFVRLFAGFLAVAIVGCGATRAHELPRSDAELARAALGIPPPSPALRALRPDWDRPQVIEDDGDGRLYEALIALDGPRGLALAVDRRDDWDPHRFDREESGPAPACPAGACGTASLPVGAPAEAALWLALLDLHWRGTTVNRSQVRTAEVGRPETTVGATRQIVRFAPAADVDCAAQHKLYSAAGAMAARPGDTVVAAVQTREGIDPGGRAFVERDPGHGQLLLRQRADAGRYVLELHVALEHGRSRDEMVTDTVLVCESDRPIDFAALPGIERRVGRVTAGHWAAAVWPR